jgi:hypothetical protein
MTVKSTELLDAGAACYFAAANALSGRSAQNDGREIGSSERSRSGVPWPLLPSAFRTSGRLLGVLNESLA